MECTQDVYLLDEDVTSKLMKDMVGGASIVYRRVEVHFFFH